MISMRKTAILYVVVIPFPAQGHINSLLHISYKLVSQGFNIIFVNTDFTHKRIVQAQEETGGAAAVNSVNDDQQQQQQQMINFVSLPDGLHPEDQRRNEFGRLFEGMLASFPSKLEELIQSFNSKTTDDQAGAGAGSGPRIITCIIADLAMAWTLEVAHKLGIKGAVHWPMAASYLLFQTRWPEFQHNGIIDSNGFPLKHEKIQLHPGMPIIDTMELPWYTCGTSFEDRSLIFKLCIKYIECLNLTDWWLCNSALEFEPESFALLPNLRPIGPLISTSTLGGQFWPQDLSCLSWLDEQKPKSVIFISFGSLTIFNLEQFQQLVSAVSVLARPVLWVVRTDFTASGSKMEFPNQFQGNNDIKIVKWAPQLKVLSHPSIACFVSHCGWNSTMEGLANGVPFLCWPYYADQMLNKSYICDVWKVGLSLEKNENGIVTSDEIRVKVEQLLHNHGIHQTVLRFKEVAMKSLAENGNSSRNFDNFTKWLHQESE